MTSFQVTKNLMKFFMTLKIAPETKIVMLPWFLTTGLQQQNSFIAHAPSHDVPMKSAETK